MGKTLVAVSGSFDPLHDGHINLLKEARALVDELVVILKGDRRLTRKKGHFLMNAEQRKKIVEGVKWVDRVIIYDTLTEDHYDFSGALEQIRPNIYCAGADKNIQSEHQKVLEICERLGIEIKYGVGGDKISNSSEILRNYVNKINGK